jgi:thiol-disulfide isomerase/thioredoxin
MTRLVVLLVCAVLTIAGCGAKNQPAAAPGVTSVEVRASSVPGSGVKVTPVKVPEQLKFTAKTVDGKDFSGESLVGKPVVFWFWTPWCPRCQGEAEDIAAAAQENAGKVTFVGVAAQDQIPAMQRFINDHRLGSFQHIADMDLAVWKRFGVVEQPAHAFVDRDGTIEMELRQLPTNDLLDRVRLLGM